MGDLEIPDIGGQQATVEMLMQMLHTSQQERRRLEVMRVYNGHSEDDPVLGEEPIRPDSTVNSYRVRLDELSEREQRLAETYPAEVEIVRETVRKRDEKGESE